MKKYMGFIVLLIFVTIWAIPVCGCEPNSGCADEAINLVFTIIGAIMIVSTIMVLIFCCFKSVGKRRGSRGNVCNCGQTRWQFDGGVDARGDFGGDDFGGGDCGEEDRDRLLSNVFV
jgi:hypothetical protein